METKASLNTSADTSTGIHVAALANAGVGPVRRHCELGLELQEVLLPDAGHVHQVFNFLEGAVLLPVLDDPCRHLRADARKGLELGRRRGVEIDDADGGLGGS